MKKLLIICTGIGIVAIALTYMFGEGVIPFLYTERTSIGILQYRYNFFDYYQNLKLTLNDTEIFVFTLPTRQMIPLQGADWYEDLANDLLVIVDYIILVNNITLYPMRIMGYLGQNILALCGLDVVNNPQGGLQWFITFIKFLARSEIPYI